MSNIFDLFKKIEKKESPSPITHIVVGLGNPGEKYTFTRHNAGFLAIDYLCQKIGFKCDRIKFKALVGEATIGGVRALFMKPQTFMNLSGECVRAALDFYKIKPENLIIIYDDISLDVGRLRVRRDGSAGGHNGIKSIIEHTGTQIFPRIKVGVGQKPHPNYDLASWVLSEFKDDELKALEGTFPTVCEGLEKILSATIDDAMQICNKKQ